MKIVVINSIKPDKNQPRKTFDRETIGYMAETIKKFGVIEPIHVGENNIIITGERRWRAAKIAGVKKLPVIVHKNVTPTQRLEMQLIEDIHSEGIPLYERDKAWFKLYKKHKEENPEFLYTDLAKILGVSSTAVGDTFDRLGLIKSTGPVEVAPTVISETKGLPKKERVQLIKTAEKKDIGGRRIREYVTLIKKAPEHIKRDLIKGKLEPEKAMKKIAEIESEEEPEIFEEKEFKILTCPVCKKKIRIIHYGKDGHKLEEI